MDVFLSSQPATEIDADAVVVPVHEDAPAPDWAAKALASARFTGEAGTDLLVPGLADRPVLFIGLGPVADSTPDTLRRAAARAVRRLAAFPRVALGLAAGHPDGVAAAAAVAEGAVLGNYRYDGLRPPKPVVASVTVTGPAAAEQAVRTAAITAEAVNWARDLGNTPAGRLTPAVLAERAAAGALEHGLEVRVLAEEELRAGGYGGILGVGGGSGNPPRLIEVRYAGTNGRTVGLVGKGITFDAGGLGIKSGHGMAEMRYDMCGGATVLATAIAAARLGLPTGVVAVVPAAENLPSGTAYKPGDVLEHRGGKTSEITDTDAEGRVVMADALAHVVELGPEAVIDVATLTYAVMYALGDEITGVLGSDPSLVASVVAAGAECGEPMWELPLFRGYFKNIESTVATVRNDGGSEHADAIHAALFLEEFTGGLPWAHLDIAGTGFQTEGGDLHPAGATGVAIRTLLRLLANH
ncbi:leucyl aminopeptidase [Streptomyces sp. NPDC008150]|uniref:leucyl aminopeptidase n=1 Tax=Streptomyces sp. NPDC008150 TaxID=3364816 RepID=UPI0036EE4FE5